MTAPRDPTSRRRVLASCVATLGVAIAGCTDGSGGEDGSDGDATDDGMGSPPQDVTAVVGVGPDGLAVFDPEEVRIQSGETVRWEWRSAGHTLTPQETPDGASWQGVPESREVAYTHEHRFDAVGSYQYQCSVHDDMVGVVHVQ